MEETAIRARLERQLRTQITSAEWIDLKEQRFVRDYQTGHIDWEDLKTTVDEVLKRLRRHIERTRLEQAGDLREEQEASPGYAFGEPPVEPSSLSGRTFARSSALASWNRLQTNGRTTGTDALHGALIPRGGLDGTFAQWVYLLAVELWVPTEEVANHYQRKQKSMSAESSPPKTSERAFEVAAFVWDNKLVDGERAPWPVLCQRWNERPLTKPFKHWRHFRMACLRGEKATLPRYFASNKQITNEVASGGQGILDVWSSKIRE